MTEYPPPLPLPTFSRCRFADHSWLWTGYVTKLVWTATEPDGTRVGRSDPTTTVSVAEVGPICAFCGIRKRSVSDYPRPVAPMVAP